MFSPSVSHVLFRIVTVFFLFEIFCPDEALSIKIFPWLEHKIVRTTVTGILLFLVVTLEDTVSKLVSLSMMINY